MLAQIVFFPPAASTTARDVDIFFYVLVAITGSMGLLVATLLIYFSVRYRRRPGDPVPGPMLGNLPLEMFWTLTPLAIFMVIYAWGTTLYFDAYRPPEDATVIYGIGKQWMWKFQHPEGQREIDDLHVEVGRPYQIRLTSEDVIHSFYVPEFRIHMDVLPDRYTSVWFQPTQPGTYHLFCSQYCGTNHSGMIGTVHVLERAEYEAWMNEHAEGSPAIRGHKVFLKYRCISCHSGVHGRAPVLEDLYGSTVYLRDQPPVIADDAYIRRSILNPSAQIVAGWQDIMPSFNGQVSPDEVIDLIAFIKSLHRGETPPRVEEYPPPTTTPPINSRKQEP